MRHILTILLFSAISTALPAQTQQAQPKAIVGPGKCMFIDNKLERYCGKKAVGSDNRCKFHNPNELYKFKRAYYLVQWRKANGIKNH